MTPTPVLAVDLDGTLIRTDMLYETFWSAFSSRWTTPLIAMGALGTGRSMLKHKLGQISDVDVASLPYNPDVIAYIEDWRARGGQTALVTASNQEIADRIAQHLGIFDEVYGSSTSENLKGSHKASFLQSRFKDGGFAYVGDASADLPVWQASSQAVTVDLRPSLRTQVDQLAPEAEHLTTRSHGWKPYIKALRPHQWLKNILVFVPMLAAHELTWAATFLSLLAFIAFSVVASSVYLMNDLLDLSSDRAHARKCKRPLASGDLPIEHGTLMAPLLLLLGFAIALTIGLQFTLVMILYYVVTTAYSLLLKRKMIVDICTLAGLYTLRIMAGGAAAGIPVSAWLLAFSIFFFFSLATVKRQAELVDGVANEKTEIAGRGYRTSDAPLVANMALAAGYVSVLVMALYLNSPAVQQLYSTPTVLWGICLVLLYWISRIVMLAHRGEMHDDPVVFAARDRISQVCLVIMVAIGIGSALT